MTVWIYVIREYKNKKKGAVLRMDNSYSGTSRI